MNYEIVNLEKKILVGKSIKTRNENCKAMTDIGMMWQEFNESRVFETIKNRLNTKAIGLYTEYEGDHTKPYRFMCGCEVSVESEISNSDLELRTIASGKYAKFSIKGDIVMDVAKAWGQIWSMDLDRKYDYDFELFHNDSNDMTNQTIEIYISIN